MTTLWILFGILQILSLSFTFLVLWRLYEYIKRYRFDESKYTLLFGFVHLRWIAVSYVMFSSLWIFVSYFLFIKP